MSCFNIPQKNEKQFRPVLCYSILGYNNTKTKQIKVVAPTTRLLTVFAQWRWVRDTHKQKFHSRHPLAQISSNTLLKTKREEKIKGVRRPWILKLQLTNPIDN